MKLLTNPHNVQPGQLWADNDRRSRGRLLRIREIDTDYAWAEVESDAVGTVMTQVGKVRQIRLDRFKPTSTGYRLIKESPDA